MKKYRKLVLVLLLVSAILTLTACGKNNNDKAETVASALTAQFKKEIKSNKPLDVAKKLSENNELAIMTEALELTQDDIITGFKTEIKDYKKAYVIRPMIGSIPFIAYIFEVESPKEFESTLKENADLRWNICTEADNMETAIIDNYVFFVMSPKNFEE